MQQLAEQYRPRDWTEVVGQDATIKTLRTLARRGWGGRNYWLCGKVGTGKTTIASLIAREIADPTAIEEIDAAELTADYLRTVKREMQYRALGERNGRVWIVNESHTFSTTQVEKLLTVIDPKFLPDYVAFIFTTSVAKPAELFDMAPTDSGKRDWRALLSRCAEITLAQRGINEPYALALQTIARAEGLDGQELPAYLRLLNDCGQDMRRAIGRIEAGEMLQ